MGRIRRYYTIIFSLLTLVTAFFMGCGKNNSVQTDEPLPMDNEKEVSTELESEEINVDDISEFEDDYLEIALNVYYNDSEHKYFKNEAGKSIKVTKEGQYSLTFDCATDLSDEAKASGVTSLKNLTAIYILDMGVAKGLQSQLMSCNIVQCYGHATTISKRQHLPWSMKR